MTDVTVRGPPEQLESHPASGVPDQEGQQRTDPPPPPENGVELRRLLALTRLSAVQAVELGAAVLAAALQGSGPFRVGTDGRVLPGTGRRPVTVPVVAAVLGQVVDAARVPGRRADPAADDLLAELERAVADLPDAGGAGGAGGLAGGAPPSGRRRR